MIWVRLHWYSRLLRCPSFRLKSDCACVGWFHPSDNLFLFLSRLNRFAPSFFSSNRSWLISVMMPLYIQNKQFPKAVKTRALVATRCVFRPWSELITGAMNVFWKSSGTSDNHSLLSHSKQRWRYPPHQKSEFTCCLMSYFASGGVEETITSLMIVLNDCGRREIVRVTYSECHSRDQIQAAFQKKKKDH